MKNKRTVNNKIITVAYIIIAILMIPILVEQHHENNEYIKLYDKTVFTEKDLKEGANFTYSTRDEMDSEQDVAVSYKKLYGIDKVDKFSLLDEENLEVSLSNEGVKLIITNEDGNIVFYDEIQDSAFNFKPEKSGEYTVFIFGKKYTGRLCFDVKSNTNRDELQDK